MFTNLAIEAQDNRNFFMNILEFLKGEAGEYDLKATSMRLKGKNFAVGKKATVVAKIRNIGNIDSAGVKISFQLTSVGGALPAAVDQELRRINLASVKAGKQVKVKTQIKFPSGIDAGMYDVTVIVDPDEKSDDVDFSNNSKTINKSINIQ
jgi:uncharacterized membrane protein